MQESIQIATNVLDIAEDKCYGCCNHNYGTPTIALVNETLEINEKSRNLSLEICANPRVDRIVWELPSGQLLKPGQKGEHGLILKSWPSLQKATCLDVQLSTYGRMVNGNHYILAKNSRGFAEKVVKVRLAVTKTSQLASAAVSQKKLAHLATILLLTLWTLS